MSILLVGVPRTGVAATNCAALNNTAIFRSGQPPFIYDEYASAVALSEDTAVVGARADIGVGGARGALYVYVRSNGVWGFQQKLSATPFLGEVVAIDGDTIVAGMSGLGPQGSALVYVQQDGVWTLLQTLVPSGAVGQQYFGYSVAILDGRIVVGAPADNNVTGAAFVFERRHGNWEQVARVTASEGQTWDAFGWSVSISGDTALVGSGRHHGEAGIGYVFALTNGVWNEQASLSVPGNRLFGNGGITVSISGEVAAMNYVGFPKSVYLFRRSNSAWSLEATLRGRSQSLEPGFGRSLALLGDRLVVGSPGSQLVANNVGVVHVYRHSTAQWVEDVILAPAPGIAPALNLFGHALALNRTGTLVGAHGSFSGPDRSGSAYVFESDSTPPVVDSISATPSTLWPPNHRMVPVRVNVTANDDCGRTRCWISSITCSEPPRKPQEIDWQITGDLTANLRAARHGNGSGRVYTLTIACQDDLGNATVVAVTVTVPHDNRPLKR